MNKLYKHAHLIINNSEEILDGSLLIIDNKIEKVSYKELDLKEVEIIDVKGNIVVPKPLTFSEINKDIVVNELNELIKEGDVVGYYDFFNSTESLSFDENSNINKGFKDEESYKVIKNIKDKPKEISKLLLTYFLKDRVVIEDNINDLYKYLNLELGISLCDIVAFTSVNPAKLCGVFNTKGSLTKGKSADILILDKELNIVGKDG